MTSTDHDTGNAGTPGPGNDGTGADGTGADGTGADGTSSGQADAGDFFALPPFNAEAALLQLRRALRDNRALTERGSTYSFEGQEVLSVEARDGQLVARLARRPARSPEWDSRVCRNAADVRKLQDELKRRLVQWTDE